MFRRLAAVSVAALALVAALGIPAVAQDPTLGPPQATPIAEPPDVPSGDGTGVRLQTDQGDIVIGLFTESSPVAAENFLNLVNAGFYDGLGFHRLVPGFVIQGGDPAGDGTGGPGYTIPDEPVVGQYGRGIVAMARSSAPDSQGSQFFIVTDDAAEDALASYNTYAIFGRVVEGMDVVDKIVAMPTQNGDQAVDPVTIIKATVEQVELPPEPVPGDPTLEALFPAEINGEPLIIDTTNGVELQSQIDDAFRGELEGVLATLGAQLDDLSIGGGSIGAQDDGVSITAMRLAGGDGAALRGSILPLLLSFGDLQETTQAYGGKDVTIVTDGPVDGDPAASPAADGQTRFYTYANGEVLWVLQGTEPWLSAALAALP
jgi:cyclophilin family peptidyl-prolyl cis-trans isomerase